MAHGLPLFMGHWNRTATAKDSSLPPPGARPPNEPAGDSQLAQRAGLRRPPKGERRVDLSQNGSLSLSLSLEGELSPPAYWPPFVLGHWGGVKVFELYRGFTNKVY